MRKLFRSRRAVSPVVSTVLMMLVVMVGMSLLFAFFVNYAHDFQVGSGSAVLESMTVEDVWFRDSTHVEIWVYNLGKVDFEITTIYVNGTQAVAPKPLSLPVLIGKHGSITVTPSISLTPGDVCSFKIITARGSAFEGEYKWQ
jgi:FlaG/FlaF family flagellin (archaellin)